MATWVQTVRRHDELYSPTARYSRLADAGAWVADRRCRAVGYVKHVWTLMFVVCICYTTVLHYIGRIYKMEWSILSVCLYVCVSMCWAVRRGRLAVSDCSSSCVSVCRWLRGGGADGGRWIMPLQWVGARWDRLRRSSSCRDLVPAGPVNTCSRRRGRRRSHPCHRRQPNCQLHLQLLQTVRHWHCDKHTLGLQAGGWAA